MKKDTGKIPSGEYCYRVVEIQDGEVLAGDLERYGKDLRECNYHLGYKMILCPYWQRTDYGTVRCDYLEKEVVNTWEDDAQEKIMAHFGISDAFEKFGTDHLLDDEVKICDVNLDEDEDLDIP